MEVIKILKRILCIITAIVIIAPSVFAYDASNLPHSMTFAEATKIYSSSDIVSATISDIDKNNYKTLSTEQIEQFYNAAADITLWRKINPTPFRGVCVNFKTKSGNKISYYYGAGVQIGKYGESNFVCYMPSSQDMIKLTYLMSEFYDSDEGVYGGASWNVAEDYDFLKMPRAEWAKETVSEAAAKSLVPYDFTNKYEKNITREEMAILIENFIVVAGNYSNMDEYMRATGTVYLEGTFADCAGRDSAIDCLYALGILSGVDGINFNPDGTITRQEAAAIMVRAAKLFMYVGTDYSTKTADWDKVDSWASFYIRWCIDKGLFQLDDAKRVYPKDNMTVQQAITVLSRLYDLATYWES